MPKVLAVRYTDTAISPGLETRSNEINSQYWIRVPQPAMFGTMLHLIRFDDYL